MLLPVTPDVLHWIEFRGVTRQPLDCEPTALCADEVADQARPMRRQSIPHHQQLARQMTQQVAEEVHHLRRANRGRIKPEVEVPPGDSGTGREHLPVEVVLQHRSLPARRPGTYPVRSLAQSAFVDEDDGAPFAERFVSWASGTSSTARWPARRAPGLCQPDAGRSS